MSVLPSGAVAETARIRLHFAVQFPGTAQSPADERIPYASLFDGDLETVLADWLRDLGQDANVVGSATYAPWIRGLEVGRRTFGRQPTYADWRRRHPLLDRTMKAVAHEYRERLVEIEEALGAGQPREDGHPCPTS